MRRAHDVSNAISAVMIHERIEKQNWNPNNNEFTWILSVGGRVSGANFVYAC